jgi:hypothetical protein
VVRKRGISGVTLFSFVRHAGDDLQEARKNFFFEKEAKNFYGLDSAFPGRLSPEGQKFFGSFFRKRTAFYPLPLREA